MRFLGHFIDTVKVQDDVFLTNTVAAKRVLSVSDIKVFTYSREGMKIMTEVC